MNIIERGKVFLQQLQELAKRTAWDWKRCPHCGSQLTIKNGGYARHPWGFEGRECIRVQRHLCHACHHTYAETSPWLARGSWYYREVHRAAVDHWLHLGTSLRRTAEVLRSWIGHQERWQLWRPLGYYLPRALSTFGQHGASLAGWGRAAGRREYPRAT